MTTSTAGELPEDFFSASRSWRGIYPGAHVGVLVMRDVRNPPHNAALQARKQELEKSLRQRWAGTDRAALRQHPVLRVYEEYYKRFDKTYHVRLQLESILFKAKAIPTGAALVEAMFMAEVDHLLLTAGHDLDAVHAPLELSVGQGTEGYRLLRGTMQAPKPDDMTISDREGIISSIVYGPDQRTQIRAETTQAVFTVYGPAGIPPELMETHLAEIRNNVRLIAPEARVALLAVYGAD
ncbi:MAG TPA: hypothetical protein VLL49_05625 [Anaerolineales bacterium]|nr:hypothetical protein [Anaerolineales bacterium]